VRQIAATYNRSIASCTYTSVILAAAIAAMHTFRTDVSGAAAILPRPSTSLTNSEIRLSIFVQLRVLSGAMEGAEGVCDGVGPNAQLLMPRHPKVPAYS
jgi:hypothetical protein